MTRYDHFIGGRWTPPVHGAYLDVHAPATREVWAHVPAGSTQDVDAAVTAARSAFGRSTWASDARHRGRALRALADLLE